MCGLRGAGGMSRWLRVPRCEVMCVIEMRTMVEEIHFKRFFNIDCGYVPAHLDAEEVGSRITRFKFLGNESADDAAKKGARMHSDFIDLRNGLAVWEEFQDSIDSQVLEREEANYRLLCD